VLPAIASILAAPQAAIITGNLQCWDFGIDPNVVKIAVIRA